MATKKAKLRKQPTNPAMALNLPPAPRKELPADLQAYFRKCEEKLGFVPNVLLAHSFDAAKLRGFMDSYNALMLGDSALTKLQREMIAVAVSSRNRCVYCLVSHGEAVRALSGDPVLGETLVMNYRAAALPAEERAMLDFAVKLTDRPETVGEADREALRQAKFSEAAIWDIVAVAAFFNMSNRMAIGVDMQANPEYHARSR